MSRDGQTSFRSALRDCLACIKQGDARLLSVASWPTSRRKHLHSFARLDSIWIINFIQSIFGRPMAAFSVGRMRAPGRQTDAKRVLGNEFR